MNERPTLLPRDAYAGKAMPALLEDATHAALVAAWDKLLPWKRRAEELLPRQPRLWQAASERKRAPADRQRGLLCDANPRLPQLGETLWPTRRKEDGLAGRARWARLVHSASRMTATR